METLSQRPIRKAAQNVGRPKGSKNKITALKLMAEEAARDRNHDKIQEVVDKVINEAMNGSFQCQKLVWQSVMSNGIPTDAKVGEKVQINIGTTYHEKQVKIKEPPIVIIPTETDDERHDK